MKTFRLAEENVKDQGTLTAHNSMMTRPIFMLIMMLIRSSSFVRVYVLNTPVKYKPLMTPTPFQKAA